MKGSFKKHIFVNYNKNKSMNLKKNIISKSYSMQLLWIWQIKLRINYIVLSMVLSYSAFTHQ